ncbi:acyl carrier protein [bacterium]|nr:acyl carrier protein [bacterium]
MSVSKIHVVGRARNYTEEVRAFVVENFLFGDGAALDDDASFLGTSVVDSTGILELVKFLEDSYGISVEDDELVPENLDSVNRIGVYLERKLSPRRRA